MQVGAPRSFSAWRSCDPRRPDGAVRGHSASGLDTDIYFPKCIWPQTGSCRSAHITSSTSYRDYLQVIRPHQCQALHQSPSSSSLFISSSLLLPFCSVPLSPSLPLFLPLSISLSLTLYFPSAPLSSQWASLPRRGRKCSGAFAEQEQYSRSPLRGHAACERRYSIHHYLLEVTLRLRQYQTWDRSFYTLLYTTTHTHTLADRATQATCRALSKMGEGTDDWDRVASNCSTGNCLPNCNKRINSNSSNWDIWARWGFPTVSSPLPTITLSLSHAHKAWTLVARSPSSNPMERGLLVPAPFYIIQYNVV